MPLHQTIERAPRQVGLSGGARHIPQMAAEQFCEVGSLEGCDVLGPLGKLAHGASGPSRRRHDLVWQIFHPGHW